MCSSGPLGEALIIPTAAGQRPLNTALERMSRQGLLAAQKHGVELPSFASLEAATAALLGEKDSMLRALLSSLGEDLSLDFSPDSLKRLEGWYFERGSPESIATISAPHAIGFYWGEVLCRSAGFQWVVEPFPFTPGTIEIGVSRSLASIMLTRGARPDLRGNKRMQSLWRDWSRYAL
jgi:hypothetical protein